MINGVVEANLERSWEAVWMGTFIAAMVGITAGFVLSVFWKVIVFLRNGET
jgi:hypothetical protein